MKAIVAALSAAVLCSVSAANAGEISVGVTPVPHGEVMEFVKPIVAKQGVDLKIVEFNDYVQPNLATDDGELDANYFQHRPYLEEFTKDHGINLVEVAAVHIEPMGVYSKQIKKINELKDGAVIAIPNDPTNGGRALLLLNKAGVITLEDPTDITATVMDIKDNPKNIEIRELEAAQLPRALEDVDAAVINTNFAMQADLIPQRDAIVIEGADSPYVNILVANPESAKKEDMKILIKAVQSEETRAFIEKQYKGAVLPAF
ncbi:MetQ/NlpA family ABC transporter substrate-binding protein [Succinatimonas hippei]|uniref:MetQ/NlpA family ABC transporter substrate-binding protein n=1 Tax=Succinatimonas hippei TaxID=626938 RepID=UPI0020118E02|nr:MetQ/NlpA family ABC transporter substrate-binding protein [Succinatimonas hippei]MCL1602439.1 MetQ/NlpA family ABC transporter substrate-binding protein [Succinatimonas hippei]MDM8120500.1 MetQ/NlpA family ABC transporter substrate-binding protein [Succinatimonas hippei]